MKHFLSRLVASPRSAETVRPAQSASLLPVSPHECTRAALAHHGAGRLAEAESMYRMALASDAENFDALHMLGVVQLQQGHGDRAVELIERAIAIEPENGIAHSNVGLAYQSLNRIDDALASLRRAVKFRPDWDGAHNSLGTMQCAAGDVAAAEASFRRAVALNPRNTDALNNLGNLFREKRQFAAAEEMHRAALAIDPGAGGTWKSLGDVQRVAGRLDDALNCFRKAVELRPEDPDALADLGSIHAARAELVEAESWFRMALQIDSKRAGALCNLGDVLRRLDLLDEAESLCRRAVAIRPDDPDMLNTLACVLLRTRALEEAEACCRKALAIRSDHAPTQITLGSILNACDGSVEAEACFRSAMHLQPDSASAGYNLAMLKLLQGDYREGLELYESRFAMLHGDVGVNPAHRELLHDPRRWHGEALAGRRIVIWTEQGFGDSLMTLRYLPLLKGRGAGKVIVLCDPELERVVGSLVGMGPEVHCAQSVAAAEFDLHCPIMSLPLLFGTTLEAIPGAVPYVAVPADLSSVWNARLAPVGKPRVGLLWEGNKNMRDGAGRSIPLDEFAPIIGLRGIQFVSLQKGAGALQIGAWRDHIVDWMEDCHDFLDTAALIDNLDLVIAIDSAVTHLAGAMGKAVWLLNRHGREWRWGQESERTPWYPSMRIFRQGKGERWAPTIARAADELTKYLRK